jgi:hypothetical protein
VVALGFRLKEFVIRPELSKEQAARAARFVRLRLGPRNPVQRLRDILDNVDCADCAEFAGDRKRPTVHDNACTLPSHAILDRGRVVGLWEYDMAMQSIAWMPFVRKDAALMTQYQAHQASRLNRPFLAGDAPVGIFRRKQALQIARRRPCSPSLPAPKTIGIPRALPDRSIQRSAAPARRISIPFFFPSSPKLRAAPPVLSRNSSGSSGPFQAP